MSELLPETLASLVASYFPRQNPTTLAQQLESSLPHLSLPVHQSTLQLAALRWRGQTFTDTTLNITTHAHGLELMQLASSAPAGAVLGSGHVYSDHGGWEGALAATLESTENTQGEGSDDGQLDPEDPGTRLAMTSGSARLTARGATWGELLYSLAGEVNVAGNYRHPHAEAEAVPISLTGRLDNQPGAFALEDLAVGVGNGKITGNISLHGLKRRTLELALRAHNLDLTFLDEAQSSPAQADNATRTDAPLFAMPEVLAGMDITASIAVSGLRAPGMAIATAKARAIMTHDQDERWQAALTLDAADYSNGAYRLTAEAGGLASQPSNLAVRAELQQADLPALLRQSGLPPTRASGTLRLQSDTRDNSGALTTLQGSAEIALALRPDNHWERAPRAGEDFQLSANAGLALEAGSNGRQRIHSLLVDNLSILGEGQHLSGSASLERGRTPWLRASFDSQKLNLPELLALLPEGPKDTGKDTPLSGLRRLVSSEVSFEASNVVLSQTNLSNISAEITSRQDRINLDTLTFDTPGGGFSSTGSLAWEGDNATLQGSATLTDVDLDQFLMGGIGADSVPVSGALHFGSSGSSQSELIANLTGSLTLAASENAGNASALSRRQVAMQVERLPDGMQLNVNTLLWGETDLSGRVRYQRGTPAALSIEEVEGTLSLLPWEGRSANKATADKNTATSTIANAAKTSASFVGNLVLSPLKMLVGDAPAAAGERLFRQEPLPLDALGDLDITLSGKLDALESRVLRARDIDLAASIAGRSLSISANSADMNGGQADVTLHFDARDGVPSLALQSHFFNVMGLLGEATYPRSGYITLTSEGASTAELAANTSGIFYLELGSGPFDYAQMSLLNADIATTMYRTLLPGFEEKTSTLDCGVALFVAEDGIATTPYGLVARTSEANLVGRAELDLKKETVRLKLDSRSREGVGLSVGSVFSNTIEVRGPLSDPR
ncbi:MAG: hypothetical protein KDI09_18225, partial [Halioglobus sp.]|nr:hypothetical protein [Halioglobus sp.]